MLAPTWPLQPSAAAAVPPVSVKDAAVPWASVCRKRRPSTALACRRAPGRRVGVDGRDLVGARGGDLVESDAAKVAERLRRTAVAHVHGERVASAARRLAAVPGARAAEESVGSGSASTRRLK
jgi:hypothetical protein